VDVLGIQLPKYCPEPINYKYLGPLIRTLQIPNFREFSFLKKISPISESNPIASIFIKRWEWGNLVAVMA
jgi:hypothetical protein